MPYLVSDVAPEDLVAPDVLHFHYTPDDEISDYIQLHVMPVINTTVNVIVFDNN
jgi:hypothetical protein